jgi:hypothetical protein
VTFYENRPTFSSAQGQYFWLGSHAYSFDVHPLEDRALLLTVNDKAQNNIC